jgi:catechol 2,3-dioxygenase-like lactoylglutathione lyase family enzyme
MITIKQLDHLVLTVADVDRTCVFYETVLNFKVVSFGEGRKALRFGNQKFNLHQQGHGVEPKAMNAMPGSADLCLITETPIDTVRQTLEAAAVAIEEGPVPRTGALGPICSVYIRDPDQNLIEIATYGP